MCSSDLEADLPSDNNMSVSLFLPWRVVADTLVYDDPGPFKWRPQSEDSLTVGFHGWHGRVVALLAREEGGFSGSAFVRPTYEAKGLRSVQVRLRRAPCPSNLVLRSEITQPRFLEIPPR